MKDNILIDVSRFKPVITDKEKKDIDNKKIDQCPFCGVNIEKHYHYHFKNEKWYKSCSFCYYSENIDKLIAMNKGDFIFLNDMSQVDLFNTLRQIYFVEYLHKSQNSRENKNTKVDEHLEEIYDSFLLLKDSLSDRKEYAANLICPSANDINIVTDYLSVCTKQEYEDSKLTLKYLRWLPNQEIFREEIQWWIEKNFNDNCHPKDYKKIILDLGNKNND